MYKNNNNNNIYENSICSHCSFGRIANRTINGGNYCEMCYKITQKEQSRKEKKEVDKIIADNKVWMLGNSVETLQEQVKVLFNLVKAEKEKKENIESLEREIKRLNERVKELENKELTKREKLIASIQVSSK